MTQWLARAAARRAHVLVVEAPGCWPLRAHLEREIARRGWRQAESPADADVLAVCGTPGPQLSEIIGHVWDLMPGPRERIQVTGSAGLDAVLGRAQEQLVDTERHRQDARTRPEGPGVVAEDAGAGMDHGPMGHGGMDHGDMGHDGMDHGDMDMAPGGIPLAGGGADRDGLEMDVLSVRLGPVLRHWPAGLVLRCTLQGDVVSAAEAMVVDAGQWDAGPVAERRPEPAQVDAARRCDDIAALLALAGWEDAAGRARGVRDTLLAGADAGADAGAAARALLELRRTVRRSRLLRWSLRDLRWVSSEELDRLGLGEELGGDTWDRLLFMLDEARRQVAGEHATGCAASRPVVTSEALGTLVTGLDLATARLVVASLGHCRTRAEEGAPRA